MKLPTMIVSGLAMIGAVGCASESRPVAQSTRLTARDYHLVVNETRDKLRSSAFLAERRADSPPAIITTQKVENLTLDIIPEAEEWMFVLNVQNALVLSQLAEKKNIRFQISPERARQLRDRSDFKPWMNEWKQPTHVLTAKFISTVRTGSNGSGYVESRSDSYHLSFSIQNLKSGAIEWEDFVEFKRSALGSNID